MEGRMIVDVNEQDIPETATLADVIRTINVDRQRQRSAPERVIAATRKAMEDAASRNSH